MHAAGHHLHGLRRPAAVCLVERLLPNARPVGNAPHCGIGRRVFVYHAYRRRHCRTVIVAVGPSSLGKVVARVYEVFSPFEVIVTRGGGLVHGVARNEVGSVVVQIRILVYPLGAHVVNRRTLRPRGMCACRQLAAEYFFGMLLGIFE